MKTQLLFLATIVGGRSGALGAVASLVIISTGLASVSAVAELQWDCTSLKVPAVREQGNVEFVFRAKNVGGSSISVKRVSSSCGCTVASINATEVPPGGFLRITAEMKLNDSDEDQQSQLNVRTDNTNQILQLATEKKIAIRIVPRIVTWAQGEPLVPKIMIVHTSDVMPLELVGVSKTDDAVTVAIDEVLPSSEYRISVCPKSTQHACAYPLKVQAHDSHDNTYEKFCYLCVREQHSSSLKAGAKE